LVRSTLHVRRRIRSTLALSRGRTFDNLSNTIMNATSQQAISNNTLKDRILALDWDRHSEQLVTKGYTIVPQLLTHEDCNTIIEYYDDPRCFRKTVNMSRHRFGAGEYKYFLYPLPAAIQTVRENFYPPLSKVANAWNNALHIDYTYPPLHELFLEKCHIAGQLLPTPLILKYGRGGYNTLHQDLYGEVFFPMQEVVVLSDPDTDFTGGEFVLVEQVPRAQSRAIVLRLRKGDSLIFTTRFRPEQGIKGYYRVQVKHGVSEIHQGTRYALGIIFHDAVN
jgi:hypothetical protein